MNDPRDYNITVRRGVFSGETLFEARVRELPDVAEYADTYEAAYALALDTIETTAEMFEEAGREMPAPHAPANEYSGRVTLRVPRTLHRALSEAAEEEGISLNQHMVTVLGYSCGYANAERTASGAWQAVAVPQPSKKKPHLEVVRSTTFSGYAEPQVACR